MYEMKLMGFFFFYSPKLGIELGTSCMLGKHFTTEAAFPA